MCALAGPHRPRRAAGALRRACIALLCGALIASPAWPQVRLPSLGESASDDVTVTTEKRLGEQIMREVRRDPAYLDDPLLLEYLQSVWQPLVAAARQHGDITPDIDTNFAWEAFLVRDRSVNAFALPGGYVGVHLGLIGLTSAADEFASVLAHELTHLTQRHIARSVSTSSRQSLLALAGIIVGLLAASRSNSPDIAQAAIMGSQAAALQGQLNFSRDMEREADRIGLTVLGQAGFAPSGMARMFEKLDHANRLTDSGAYPYLRSHPLTVERVAEARARQGSAAAGVTARPEHALMQARSRVLMDPAVQTRRRLQDLDKANAATADERLGLLYASALSSALLRDFPRAADAYAQGERQVTGGALPARTARVWGLLGVELALAQGDAALAAKRSAALPDDASRPRLLFDTQVALALGDAVGVKRQAERLQAWVSDHRSDALAWATLSTCAERQGQPLRAVRALAESHAANGDLGGAIDRLRAGQRLARSGGAQDFIESSVIDSRLRDLEGQRRRLMDELRAKNGPQREPD